MAGPGASRSVTVSVVIPAYNEEGTIAGVVQEALDVLKTVCVDYEVIVANDASTDATGRILDELVRQHDRLTVIHNPTNQGTIRTCLNLYHAAKCDWVSYLPADGQVRPREMPRLIAGLDRFDIVVGQRTRRRDPWSRLVSGWLWNLAVRVLSGLDVNDVDSVKLYPRRVLETVEVSTRSAFMEAEILLRARAQGYRIGNVEVNHHPRLAGRASGVSVRIVLEAGIDLLRFWLRNRVLRRRVRRDAR